MQDFLHTEAAGGIVLVIATIIAVAWANSPWDQSYADLWHRELAFDFSLFAIEKDLGHLINDGLMAIFFFVVGLEIKRELVHGELATVRKALLPVAAAVGGMLVPAGIYAAFNAGGDGASGWGIPMATDIAFAVGVLALLGRRAPFQLKVFILALAIVDDLGAILVIAIFYTESIAIEPLLWAGAILAVLGIVRASGVRSTDVYVAIGIAFWMAVFKSGIHATLAGVVLAMLTPAGALLPARDADRRIASLLGQINDAHERGDEEQHQLLLRELERVSRDATSPLDRLEATLHPWVSFLIVPLFALANAGLDLGGETLRDAATSKVSIGIILGLVVGKFVGIFFGTWIAVRAGVAQLPAGLRWGHVAGGALLGGIGFTVSLFITGLAFDDAVLIADAKAGIFAASLLAGVAGYAVLALLGRPSTAAPA